MKESINQLKLLLADLVYMDDPEDHQRIELLKSNIKMMESKYGN